MSASLRIVVADDEQPMREYLKELLPRLGHQVIAAQGGRQLIELCQQFAPDLVITDIKMGDFDGLQATGEINSQRPVPFIIVSAYHDAPLRARASENYIMAYLVKPVKQEDLESAIDLAMMRFEHFQTLRKETADLRQALEDRKFIERAKGIVVRRLRVDEVEAFRRLRKLASNKNQKLVEVSRLILASEELFALLERADSPSEGPSRSRLRIV